MISYKLENLTDKTINIIFYVENEFCPDYLEILRSGKKCIQIEYSDKKAIIFNKLSNIGVKIEIIKTFNSINLKENFLGIELNPVFKGVIEPHKTIILEFSICKL